MVCYTSLINPLIDPCVLPALHALQGHPESPRLWEEHINRILIDKLNLRNTTHERNIYSGTFKTHRILVLRQVDDLAIAAPTVAIAQEFIALIGQHVHLEGNSILTKFNGVEVEQTQDYIRIHCTTYISTLLSKYHWDTPAIDDSTYQRTYTIYHVQTN